MNTLEIGLLMVEVGAWLISLGLFLGGIVLIMWVGIKLFDLFSGGSK
jgi:hypothetical protein